MDGVHYWGSFQIMILWLVPDYAARQSAGMDTDETLHHTNILKLWTQSDRPPSLNESHMKQLIHFLAPADQCWWWYDWQRFMGLVIQSENDVILDVIWLDS